jgi:hypothetical protein
MVQLYCLSLQYRNIIKLLREEKIALLVLGDDTVIAIHDLHKLNGSKYVASIAELGLSIDIQLKTPATVTFCSSYFVPAKVDGRETYILTQKPGRNIVRSYTTDKQYTEIERQAYVRSNAFAYMQDYRHLPGLHKWHQLMYNMFPKAAASSKYTNPHSHIDKECFVEPSIHLAQWVTEVYHCSLDEFDKMADHIINNSSTANLLIDRDVYGLGDQTTISLPSNWKQPNPGRFFYSPIAD